MQKAQLNRLACCPPRKPTQTTPCGAKAPDRLQADLTLDQDTRWSPMKAPDCGLQADHPWHVDQDVTVHAGRVLLGVRRWAAEAFILHSLGWGTIIDGRDHVYAFDPKKGLAKRSEYSENEAWIAKAYPDTVTKFDLNVQVRMWLKANGYAGKSIWEALLEHTTRFAAFRSVLRVARDRAPTHESLRTAHEDGLCERGEPRYVETSPCLPPSALSTPPSKKRKHASQEAHLASGFASRNYRRCVCDAVHHPASPAASTSATYDEAALVMGLTVAQRR